MLFIFATSPTWLSPGPLLCLHQPEWTLEEHRLPRQPVIRRASLWQPRVWRMVPLHRHGRGRHAHLLHLWESLWHPRSHLAQRQPPSVPRRHHHSARLRQLQWQLLPVERQCRCEGLCWRILCVSPAQTLSLLPCLLWSWVRIHICSSYNCYCSFSCLVLIMFLCVLHRFLWYLWWGGLRRSQVSWVWLSLCTWNCPGTRQTDMPGWDRQRGREILGCATDND